MSADTRRIELPDALAALVMVLALPALFTWFVFPLAILVVVATQRLPATTAAMALIAEMALSAINLYALLPAVQ